MPELILRSGKRSGRPITLAVGEVIIGRDEACRIRLTSSDVSRQHCLLRCDESSVVAMDLGSRNGTYINDVPITKPTPLRPGDLLRVGPFVFQLPGASDARMADEEISGWLTEEGTLAKAPPRGVKNDTTLVPEVLERAQRKTEPLPATTLPERTPSPIATDPIVEQAAEVIREYWSSKKHR